jgi:hypothetical protein
VQNLVTASWVLSHQFLYVHMKDVKEPPAYRPSFPSGSSTAAGSTPLDRTFGGKFSAMGTGTRTGNSVEFRSNTRGSVLQHVPWAPESAMDLPGRESDATGQRKAFADTLTANRELDARIQRTGTIGAAGSSAGAPGGLLRCRDIPRMAP